MPKDARDKVERQRKDLGKNIYKAEDNNRLILLYKSRWDKEHNRKIK